MTTNTNSANTLQLGPVIQHDGYTLQEAGTIQLGKKSFKVEIQTIENSSSEPLVWLEGARGAKYTLQPTRLVNPNGVYRVISWKSGAPLRVQGNEVRVVMLGTIIEVLAN